MKNCNNAAINSRVGIFCINSDANSCQKKISVELTNFLGLKLGSTCNFMLPSV